MSREIMDSIRVDMYPTESGSFSSSGKPPLFRKMSKADIRSAVLIVDEGNAVLTPRQLQYSANEKGYSVVSMYRPVKCVDNSPERSFAFEPVIKRRIFCRRRRFAKRNHSGMFCISSMNNISNRP